MITMPRRHKQALGIATAIPIAACLFAFSLGPAPEKALAQFYSQQAPEELLTKPLAGAGREIVPVVLRELPNKEMPRRRYAIQFLGEGKYRDALPALEAILDDESEQDYFRADALEAISSIDPLRGRQLAALHAARSDYLGVSAKALAN
jgi:HEAT repeat protein